MPNVLQRSVSSCMASRTWSRSWDLALNPSAVAVLVEDVAADPDSALSLVVVRFPDVVRSGVP